MWGSVALVVFFSFVTAKVASQDIMVTCEPNYDLPPIGNSPSPVADLKGEALTVDGQPVLNISWSINIDASTKYLTGTHIWMSRETYLCEYSPSLTEANLNGYTKVWFHYLAAASIGTQTIEVSNFPMAPNVGVDQSKTIIITIPAPPADEPETTHSIAVDDTISEPQGTSVPVITNYTSIAVAIFGGLAGLMILISIYVMYKNCGAKFASLGFKPLPTSNKVPIPVLMVYPAENSSFQRAVVALAEFLQWHGGCSIAVDLWQQGKIAEQGPMRWLAEQAKAAERVLIVCPQTSSQASQTPLVHSLPEPSIPAAAHDLYPLILNMVASQAKNTSDLAKFWVVQLGDKTPSHRPPQLKACKSFCLMKDMNKLCRSLLAQRQNQKKKSGLIFRPGVSHSGSSTEKLREAVEYLVGTKQSIFNEAEPLKSVVSTI